MFLKFISKLQNGLKLRLFNKEAKCYVLES